MKGQWLQEMNEHNTTLKQRPNALELLVPIPQVWPMQIKNKI